MEAAGRYILSVTAASVITGILYTFQDKKSTHGALVRLVSGLFLAFTIVQPVSRINLDNILTISDSFRFDAEAAAASGEILSHSALHERIKTETEAYILDKAGLYQADISVEVILKQDDLPIPEFVTIRGNVSPFARQQMQDQIAKDLGISKENQVWIGYP